jgi:hypothetical protein
LPPWEKVFTGNNCSDRRESLEGTSPSVLEEEKVTWEVGSSEPRRGEMEITEAKRNWSTWSLVI